MSMTCYYRDSEFLAVGQWIYNNFDDISGISFLPYSDHSYAQAPYEPVSTGLTYNKLAKDFPKEIQWDIVETSDNTEGISDSLACVGSSCEL